MIISFSSDITGFPLIHLTELGFDVHLLPITKSQFASFAETDQTFSVIYEHAKNLNPAPQRKDSTNRNSMKVESLLMTGILPEEARKFAIWLDNDEPTSDYELPDVTEWRAVYDCLQYERCEQYIDEVLDNSPSEEAQTIIRRILKRQPQTLLELSLMRNGIVEWVKKDAVWVGLGAPNPKFYPNTFEPLKECVEPIDATQRMRTFGFRLIRIF